MNLEQSLRDRRLLGGLPCFRDLRTFTAWLVFVRAVEGLPMTDADLEVFRRHTGRQTPRAGGYPEAVAVVGVQSGKTRIAAAFAAHAAITGEPGTHALLLGQDYRGAMRVLLGYARAPFETIDAFKAEVSRATADSLELTSGVSLSAYPCRPAAVRGLRACIVVIDELAFFVTTEGRPVDVEMLRVARGRVATTGGKIIVLSSPYAQTGALYDLHRKHYGRDDSDVLVWQASAPAMNPTLPADYLARMAQDDPDAYRSEVLGEFRAGVSTFFDPDVLEMSVAAGIRERAPDAGRTYVAHYDASGGRVDAAALAIAHADDERVVLDVIRAWPAPHDPAAVIAEACERLRAYRVREITGDRYSGEFVAEQFRAHGVRYRAAERDRSAIYLDALPLVQAGRVVLLDDPALLRELRGLERRRGTSGRDRIDHRPGAHDDRAVAAAGALAHARRPARGASMFHAFTGRPIDPAEFTPFPFWR